LLKAASVTGCESSFVLRDVASTEAWRCDNVLSGCELMHTLPALINENGGWLNDEWQRIT